MMSMMIQVWMGASILVTLLLYLSMRSYASYEDTI